MSRNVSDLGNIDGVDMWEALVSDTPSPRTQFVHNIDDIGDVYAALRHNDWKYIKGNVHKGIADGWYGESGREPNVAPYDINTILRSQTAVTIAGYITRRQIKLKYADNSSRQDERWLLLNAETVFNLREQAQLNCTQPPVECQPREAPCLFNIPEDPCERQNLADTRPDVLAEMELLLKRYRQTVVPAKNRPSDPMADPALWNHTWTPWLDDPQVKVNVMSVNGQQLVREAVTAAVILIVVVVLVAVLLRIGSPIALIFKFPDHNRKRQLNLPPHHDLAEKTNLTFTQTY